MVGCAKPAPSTGPAPAPAAPQTLDIGVAAPLTGPAANLGESINNAALMAIEDQNDQGGVTIAGQKYVLNPVIRDTKFDLLVGKYIAEELIFDKKVKVIVGPSVADSVGAQSVTEPNKVILFMLGTYRANLDGPREALYFHVQWASTSDV